jgi:hypothetical protein
MMAAWKISVISFIGSIIQIGGDLSSDFYVDQKDSDAGLHDHGVSRSIWTSSPVM